MKDFVVKSNSPSYRQFRFTLRYFSGHAAHIPWRWEAWAADNAGAEKLIDSVTVSSDHEPIYDLQFLTDRFKAYGFIDKNWKPEELG